ncbi:MAG: glycosyltransferase [Pyrinomonadaceae bacterium]
MIFAFLLLIAELPLLAVALWNVLSWPRVTAAPVPDGKISVLIPARNEAANIGECLACVVARDGVIKEILIYDDHSTDATPRIVEQQAQLDRRIRLLPAAALPSDWVGKNFACAQLANAAQGEWLLFLDADARLSEAAAARMLSEASERQLTLLSCWPALELKSFWEKTLLPLLNFLVFTVYPAPLSMRRPDPALGLAHGACLLVRREQYFAVGGHTAVRNAITEDIRLAHLWRERGERGLCLDGTGTLTVRMYSSLSEIWRGFEKNFFPGFRSELTFWAFIALHSILFLLPFGLLPLLSFRGGISPSLILLTVACVLLMRLLLAVRFKQPLWPILLHPVAEAFLIILALSSWWRCHSSKGVEWKGRQYHPGAQA